MSPNVAIARLWCPLGMLLACVVKLGDLRCAGPVRQRSWRASLCLKKRGTRGVSESGGPMQFISEKFGFWSLARRLTVGAVAQAQRPLPGCIHYTLHAWAAEWGECVRVAEALKSRLPLCVPPCLVAFLVAIQLGVCVGRTWWITALNKWWFSIAMLVYQSVLVQSNRFYLLVIKHSNWMQFAIPKCPINGGLQLGKLSIWVIWHCHILPKGNRQNCGFSATNMTFNALVLSGQNQQECPWYFRVAPNTPSTLGVKLTKKKWF